MQPQFTFINDGFVAAEKAKVHVSDLSLQRGYGIFDYLRLDGNRPLYTDFHLERFFHSAQQLRLAVPFSAEELKAIILDLAGRNSLPSSGIRITLTGGLSPDVYSIARPNLIITQHPLQLPDPGAFAKGISLATFAHQRQLPQVKTVDYLMAIWLQPWIKEQGADDVLYHHNGLLAECPRANFFLVAADGTVVTPAEHILKGITRRNILAHGGAHFPIVERAVTLQDLEGAREAFIASTTKGVLPVTAVDGRPVNGGKPGSTTMRLQALIASLPATL